MLAEQRRKRILRILLITKTEKWVKRMYELMFVSTLWNIHSESFFYQEMSPLIKRANLHSRPRFHKSLKTSFHRRTGLRKDVFMVYERVPRWVDTAEVKSQATSEVNLRFDLSLWGQDFENSNFVLSQSQVQT